jgi:hypothetical protein
MNETPLEPAPPECSAGSLQDLRSSLRLAGICLGWAVVFVGSVRLVRSDLLPAGAIPWIVASVPSVAAVFVLVAYSRYLRQTDELQRLIQLQALALGFGGGFFAICGYSLFEELGAPATEGVDIVVVMPVLYTIGVLVGTWRYR